MMFRPVSPYRGILPYRYVDREIFFGREQVVERLLAKVLLYRLTILFGDSGAGKSSVVNAGLVPALEKENLLPERLRVRPTAETPFLLERIPRTPAGNRDFLPSIFDPPPAEDTGATSIAISLDEFRAKTSAEYEHTPVLLLDQFEELFTLFKAPERELQRQVLDAIFQILRDPDRRTKILLSIREDYFGKLEVLAKAYPEVMDFRVRLLPLEPEAATHAILGAYEMDADWPSRIDPALAGEIVTQLSAGTGLISSTQLQIVCSRLWDAYASVKPVIGMEEFRALGGIQGILGQFFNTEAEKLGPIRALAVKALGSLVTDEGTRDVVSDAKLHQLLHADAAPPDIDAVLDSLDKQRLINRREQNGGRYNEVASEYLSVPLQSLGREQKVEEERARVDEFQQKLEASRTEYQRTLARERRKRNIVLSVVTIVVLTFATIVYLAYSASAAKSEIVSLKTSVSEALNTARTKEQQVADQLKELTARNAVIETQRREIEQLKVGQQGPTQTLPKPVSQGAPSPGAPTRSPRMLKSIDLLIGLALIMLMISMAVTVLTQFFNGLINLRGRQLRQGLAELINQLDPNLPANLAMSIAHEVLLHPLIRGTNMTMGQPLGTVIHREELTKMLMVLAAGEGSQTVSTALKELLAANGVTDPAGTLTNVRQLALELEKANPGLANNVRQNIALMQEAGSDLVAKINSWFDQTMDRVSERFTSITRYVTFLSALLVAMVIQIDTLALVNRLSMDDALRDSLVKEAQQATTPPARQTTPAPVPTAATPAPMPSSTSSSNTAPALTAEQQNQVTTQYREFLESRGLISIPRSWNGWVTNWKTVNPFGVLISVFLLNLGAPFWYNALKNLLNLRSTLAAKDDAQRNQRQSSDPDQSAAAATAAGATPATSVAIASVAGERGDLNAVG